jgi:hypothetical protein
LDLAGAESADLAVDMQTGEKALAFGDGHRERHDAPPKET